MSTDIVPASGPAALTIPVVSPMEAVAALKQRYDVIQTVMHDVMRDGVDYGVIPGTQGKSLKKPGAEKIGVIFAFAPRYTTSDLHVPGEVAYRVLCEIYSRETGLFLGSGQGECSSGEERYKWRKAVNKAEYDAAPAEQRRTKFMKNGQMMQVRQDPENVRNTVLKQAEKRALVGATRYVSGCSDMFEDPAEDGISGRIGPMGLQLLLDLMGRKGMTEAGAKARLEKKGHSGELAEMHFSLWETFTAWLYKLPDAKVDETPAAAPADEPIDVEAEEDDGVDPDFEALTEANLDGDRDDDEGRLGF